MDHNDTHYTEWCVNCMERKCLDENCKNYDKDHISIRCAGIKCGDCERRWPHALYSECEACKDIFMKDQLDCYDDYIEMMVCKFCRKEILKKIMKMAKEEYGYEP